MEQEYYDLWRKCKALKEGQFLYCTFGPENYFKIQATGDGYFNIASFRNKWSFQKEGKLESHDSFNDVKTLRRAVLRNPKWYAENVFSLQLVHFSNWVNFVKAFYIAEIDVQTYGQDTNYYVKKISE